jgi:hypothetical protein
LSKEHFSHFALEGSTQGSRHFERVHLASAPKQEAQVAEIPNSLTRHLSTHVSMEDLDKHFAAQSLKAAVAFSLSLMIAAS